MWKQPMYLPAFHPTLPMEWFTAMSQEEPVLVQRKGDTYTIDMDIVAEDGEPFLRTLQR